MVQKPPVDIEWYDDGFSMEEQRELAKEVSRQRKANRVKIKVTEEYHENEKDKIISRLRQEAAANEEYIHELEEKVKQRQLYPDLKEYEKLQRKYKKLNDKYVALYNNPDLRIEKHLNTIKDLKDKIKQLEINRDELIYKLTQCSQ